MSQLLPLAHIKFTIMKTTSTFFYLFICSAFLMSETHAQEICSGADTLIYTDGMAFIPNGLGLEGVEIVGGTTVGWVNTGGMHNANGDISSLDGLSFNNPEPFSFDLITVTDEPACIGTFQFTVIGEYNYDCSGYAHAESGMVAKLNVIMPLPDNVDDQQSAENLVKIYPNPVSSLLTIENPHLSTITIYNAQGRVVFEFEGSKKESVDVSGFSSGVYTVEVDGEMHKLIVE